MPWELIQNNRRSPRNFEPWKRREGLFLKKAKSSGAQIGISADLAEALGSEALKVYRDGHRFLLVATTADDAGSRMITGRGDGHRPRKFSCRELYQALDDERVYVREIEEGVYEL